MASRQGTPYLLSMIGIYKITSPSNKVYIGQSTNIEKRWSGYSTNKKKMKEQTKLFNSFIKFIFRYEFINSILNFNLFLIRIIFF